MEWMCVDVNVQGRGIWGRCWHSVVLECDLMMGMDGLSERIL